MDGSVDNVCDVTTGECNCKPNIIGELCDEVEDGWWNFPTPEGNFFLKSLFVLFKTQIHVLKYFWLIFVSFKEYNLFSL